ncbi:MAG: hypothetical protein HY286_17025 [Planctomycetes bacterium]|nr:hypothetical protein [Planctomycetota bacterium]
MPNNRREFLKLAARDALISGVFINFWNCYQGESRPKPAAEKDDLQKALAAAKRDSKVCVAWVLPDDELQRNALGDGLLEMMIGLRGAGADQIQLAPAPDMMAVAVLASSVIVFLSKKAAKNGIAGFVNNETLICVDENARRERGASLDEPWSASAATLASALAAIVHGENNSILINRAARARAAAGDGWKKAYGRFVESMEKASVEERQWRDLWRRFNIHSGFLWDSAARESEDPHEGFALRDAWIKIGNIKFNDADAELLIKETPPVLAAVVSSFFAKETTATQREAARRLILQCYFSAGDGARAELPFGIHIQTQIGKSSGCGNQTWGAEVYDCGMALVGEISRKLLRFDNK